MKIFSTEEASDIIKDLVCDSGSQVVDCQHCGRVHYDSTGEFMKESELKKLDLKAENNPEKYIGHNGTVHWGTVMGKSTVINCPCNFLRMFENTVWSNRRLVSEYLIRKSTEILEKAKQISDLASKTTIVKKT